MPEAQAELKELACSSVDCRLERSGKQALEQRATMSSQDIQKEISACKLCRPAELTEAPDRPPARCQGVPLFLTEAPPESDGFWAITEPPDQVQQTLFSILGELRAEFQNLTPGRGGFETFSRHFFANSEAEMATEQVACLATTKASQGHSALP